MDKPARTTMAGENRMSRDGSPRVPREELIALLNEDLAREYQAIIAYVVYSQTLKGAAYMAIAAELQQHAAQNCACADHRQADRLSRQEADRNAQGCEAVRQSGGNAAIRSQNEERDGAHYRDRVRQCERWANSRWPNRSVRSWWKNRNIRSTLPRHSALTCPGPHSGLARDLGRLHSPEVWLAPHLVQNRR